MNGVKAEGWLQARHVHMPVITSDFASLIKNDPPGERSVALWEEWFFWIEFLIKFLSSSLESDAIKEAMEYELVDMIGRSSEIIRKGFG